MEADVFEAVTDERQRQEKSEELKIIFHVCGYPS